MWQKAQNVSNKLGRTHRCYNTQENRGAVEFRNEALLKLFICWCGEDRHSFIHACIYLLRECLVHCLSILKMLYIVNDRRQYYKVVVVVVIGTAKG